MSRKLFPVLTVFIALSLLLAACGEVSQMAKIILATGGARSGKSAYMQELAVNTI